MSDDIHQWLTDRASLPGMLGCAVNLPERGYVSRGSSQACPGEKVEAILNQLTDTLATLAANGLSADRLNWTFGSGHIHLITRPDGASLALAAAVDTEAARNLETLAGEFLALNLGF